MFDVLEYTAGVAGMQPPYEITVLQVQNWKESGIDLQGSDVEGVRNSEVVHSRMFLLFGKQQKGMAAYCLNCDMFVFFNWF